MLRRSGNRGFTIIEMAIVMIIIGLLIGFGMSLVRPLTERSKRIESKETVKAANESIVGYAASNDRIPDWADNIPDGTIDEFCEVVTRRNDAVSRPVYYFFDTQFLTTGSICGRKSTNLTICRNAACTNRIPNVVFSVISGAEDFNPQTGIVTTPGCPAGQTCIGVYDTGTANIDNCTAASDCPNYEAGQTRLNRPEEYDDIVAWVTLPELRTKVDCQGPQLKILNNELAPGSMSSPYSATIFVEGGIPFGDEFKWCVEIGNRDVSEGIPGGLSITPNFVRYPDDSTSPTACSDQPETAWSSAQAENLLLSSGSNPLTDTGSFLFRVYVRDNSNAGNDPACDPPENNLDNCVEKSFVLTINP